MLRSLPPGQELDGALFRGTLPALLSGQTDFAGFCSTLKTCQSCVPAAKTVGQTKGEGLHTEGLSFHPQHLPLKVHG